MLTVLVEQRRWLQRYNPDAVFWTSCDVPYVVLHFFLLQ
jgi:hypothetical protein